MEERHQNDQDLRHQWQVRHIQQIQLPEYYSHVADDVALNDIRYLERSSESTHDKHSMIHKIQHTFRFISYVSYLFCLLFGSARLF